MKKNMTVSTLSVVSIIAGILYGLAVRVLVQAAPDFFKVMSFGFLFLGPIAIGAVTAYINPTEAKTSWKILMAPWLAIALGCLATYIVALEGFICIAMYLPAGLILASFGAWMMTLSIRVNHGKKAFFALVMLPFLSPIVENQIENPYQLKVVKSQIEISASEEKIWNEIKSVRKIEDNELNETWVHKIGFPKPLSAEIDKEAVGGIRDANFVGGLTFKETVTEWVPLKKLGFNIKANTEEIPPTTLDEHVTIGGPFFDVLYGEYELEKQGDKTILHLTSRFRLTTHFNWYAALWTEAVMQSIQGSILKVVKARTEKVSGS